jgi:exopolyphosphatase / guanosine-5'-triphosphate,3'-diphosphate pyrophosphatase
MEEPRTLAVIDVGSNSFRLVVFGSGEGWWKRTDEIHETVRIGEGLDATGELQPEPVERALETLEMYAHFCRATRVDEVRPVATSAIRDAANQAEFLRAARKRTGLEIEVLSPEAEAFYGYLAAVNSTTLADGVVLDLGGGSMQLTRVADRRAVDMRSWPLGAVRMTERFLSAKDPPKPKHIRALRDHVAEALAEVEWLGDPGQLAGIGGTIRNLAAAAELQADLPSFGVQGFRLRRESIDTLVDRLAEMPAAERGRVPGVKAGRGDLILAGALVVQAVVQTGGFDAIEVTEAGLREGVFFETLLGDQDPPLFGDVREASVRNLAVQYGASEAHVGRVARLALQMWDELAAVGRHPGDPEERELLTAAAALHDIGTVIDYDDHHKHSRYMVLNAGLPGFTPRETALIGQMCRYHRKGSPTLGELAPLAREGDAELLARCAAVLRIAEQLERARDQAVDSIDVAVTDGVAKLRLRAHDDVTVGRWGAQQQRDIFETAFGLGLEVSAARLGRPAGRP